MISHSKIREWLELGNKSSTGPWHIGHVSEADNEYADIDDAESSLVAAVRRRRDQAFICSARNITSDVEELLKENEEYRKAFRVLCKPDHLQEDYGELVKRNERLQQECEEYRETLQYISDHDWVSYEEGEPGPFGERAKLVFKKWKSE